MVVFIALHNESTMSSWDLSHEGRCTCLVSGHLLPGPWHRPPLRHTGDLCVWYSIDTPDRVAIVPIKGQVEDIERTPGGKTEVVVDEGVHTVPPSLLPFRPKKDRLAWVR